jgi:outer membrane protein OmpA-like peptidoglycan-associated protein
MTQRKTLRIAFVRGLSAVLIALLTTVVYAESIKVEGLILGRNGDTMILKTSDSSTLPVTLTDSTQVSQVQGMFKARRKQMSMAALIPGLAVQVEATFNDQRQWVAKSVKFKADDLEQAQAIQAGMHETKVQAQQNQEALQRQNAALEAQNAALQQQQAALSEQEKKIAANKAAVAANSARFGQLDDYYILDEVTVYFANGKVKVDPKYNPQLVALAQKAHTINGYMIEVKGYASSMGSVALNQKLSEDRADNVTNILLQQGHVPLTRMLAPGAMGESRQVGNDKTAEGQAENRRVVVRVLQNKAIAGT